MAAWANFAAEDPELADTGARHFAKGIAYLATVRPDGSPRVHPVTPIIGGGRLFLFMEPISPKGFDLRREPRYMLHAQGIDSAGTGGEFWVRGHASFTDSEADRAVATQAASYTPADRYILFELDLSGAAARWYQDGQPKQRRWGKP